MSADSFAGGSELALETQATFRAVLDAMSQPGTRQRLIPDVRPPRPLQPAAAAVLCTLADEDTAIFLDRRLAGHDAVMAWLRFHTGARLVSNPNEAVFAVIGDPEAMPPLSRFRQGTDAYPDRAATVILQMATFSGARPLVLEGPGIVGSRRFAPEPLPAALVRQIVAGRSAWPCGVDLLFTTADSVAGIPRSARVRPGGR